MVKKAKTVAVDEMLGAPLCHLLAVLTFNLATSKAARGCSLCRSLQRLHELNNVKQCLAHSLCSANISYRHMKQGQHTTFSLYITFCIKRVSEDTSNSYKVFFVFLFSFSLLRASNLEI